MYSFKKMFCYFRLLKVVCVSRPVSYSGDEYKLVSPTGLVSDKANNLGKDLEKEQDDECRVPVLSRGVHDKGR